MLISRKRRMYACACSCVRARVQARVYQWVRECVRACVHACMDTWKLEHRRQTGHATATIPMCTLSRSISRMDNVMQSTGLIKSPSSQRIALYRDNRLSSLPFVNVRPRSQVMRLRPCGVWYTKEQKMN